MKNHEFSQKKFQNFKIYFFAFKSNYLDFGLNHNVEDTPLHILNTFSGEVMIAFSEIIHKKFKKSHIFSHVV